VGFGLVVSQLCCPQTLLSCRIPSPPPFLSFLSVSFNNSFESLHVRHTGGASNAKYKKMVRHILKWTYTASFASMVLIVWAIVGTFHPHLIWKVETWTLYWLVFHATRSLYSLSKVMLCRLPSNEDNKSKSARVSASGSSTRRSTAAHQSSAASSGT
jgi:hypothetical protein